jgi:DNA replication protein DnaC
MSFEGSNVNKNCPDCGGLGYIYVNKKEAKTCECVRRNNTVSMLAESKLPKKLRNLSLEDWNPKQNHKGEDLDQQQAAFKQKILVMLEKIYDSKRFPHQTLRFKNEDYSSLIFVGEKGSGKSLCLSVICQSAVNNGASVRYFDWYELISSLDRYTEDEEYRQIRDSFYNMDLIVVDNIDYKSEIRSNMVHHLRRFFNHRTNNEKMTILTSTNYSNKQSEITNLTSEAKTITLP